MGSILRGRKMKVLVCGGRDYDNYTAVREALDGKFGGQIKAIAQGGASGADACAARYAKERGVELLTFHADWKKLGRSAGPERNKRMLAEFSPYVVVAFPGGRGTAHMKSIAVAAGVQVVEIDEWFPF
jgi:predicted Rossmann-fold nucleotide-binding protein